MSEEDKPWMAWRFDHKNGWYLWNADVIFKGGKFDKDGGDWAKQTGYYTYHSMLSFDVDGVDHDRNQDYVHPSAIEISHRNEIVQGEPEFYLDVPDFLSFFVDDTPSLLQVIPSLLSLRELLEPQTAWAIIAAKELNTEFGEQSRGTLHAERWRRRQERQREAKARRDARAKKEG